MDQYFHLLIHRQRNKDLLVFLLEGLDIVESPQHRVRGNLYRLMAEDRQRRIEANKQNKKGDKK